MKQILINIAEKQWNVWVAAKPVEIEPFENMLWLHKGCHWHKSYDQETSKPPHLRPHKWMVSEGRSGMSLAGGSTQKEAIQTARQRLERRNVTTIAELRRVRKRAMENYSIKKPLNPDLP